MDWLTKIITRFGNTINYRLGYEIYKEEAAISFCEDCYLPQNSIEMLNAQFISDVACNGCRCSLSAK